MRSDTPIRYSIVVPFYNEQENIPTLYMKITEVMDSIGEPYEMVFVDDGSKDNSYRVLSDIYEHDRRVNVVRLRRNFGQTAALKAGLILRAAMSSFRWTAICSTIPRKFRASWKKLKKDSISSVAGAPIAAITG